MGSRLVVVPLLGIKTRMSSHEIRVILRYISDFLFGILYTYILQSCNYREVCKQSYCINYKVRERHSL
jgi:hypothetical protein